MKTLIFLIIASLMYSSLNASVGTLKKREFKVSYSNDKADMVSAGLFGLKAKGFTDLKFKVGMYDGLKKLGEKYYKNRDFLKKVVFWVSYDF
jgi:hypothetical protein